MSLGGRRREIIIGTLAVMVLVWLLRPAAPPPDSGEPAAETDALAGLRGLPQIELEPVGSTGGDYRGGGRNLFDYGVMRPPPPSPEDLERMRQEEEARRRAQAEAAAEAERLRAEALRRQQEDARRRAEERAVQTAAAPPPTRAAPPVISFKLIGLVGEPGNKIAIFLDGEDFLLAREGEPVKGDFQVRSIGYETLTMGFTDPQFEQEKRVLTLGG